MLNSCSTNGNDKSKSPESARKILTKDTQSQAFLIQLTLPSLSVIESSARNLLSVVKVRRGEVHHRARGISFRILLCVTYTGQPCQKWRKNRTGSSS